MDMEANWFGVPYGNYWSGWLFWLLPIFIGTRFIRGKTSAGSSGPGTLYDLLPLISYAAQFVWCGSIAVFGNVRNPGLALVGLWTMFLPCLIAFLSWLSRQDSGEKHANAKFE